MPVFGKSGNEVCRIPTAKSLTEGNQWLKVWNNLVVIRRVRECSDLEVKVEETFKTRWHWLAGGDSTKKMFRWHCL